jgi:hypothetical protein
MPTRRSTTRENWGRITRGPKTGSRVVGVVVVGVDARRVVVSRRTVVSRSVTSESTSLRRSAVNMLQIHLPSCSEAPIIRRNTASATKAASADP